MDQVANQYQSPQVCPLCDDAGACSSWLGSTTYRDRRFCYVQCLNCSSLYCAPMPDLATLTAMYGTDYSTGFSQDTHIDDPKEPGRVLNYLKLAPPGVFLDFGCGIGSLLTGAIERGWHAIGIEFDPRVVHEVEERTGAKVVAYDDQESLGPPVADVLHLGDVLEHLTDLNSQMPAILRLLKPGGILLAQGPLENNGNLFVWVMQMGRKFRPARQTQMAPYHVMLATAQGQLALFQRFGLETIEFDLTEVSWPAPARISPRNFLNPRRAGLYVLRRCSRMLSSLRPKHWGNRYFYVGRQST
ncbi:hypothetical protein BH10PLA2_BH10PLA2_13870 [soil metagenome]